MYIETLIIHNKVIGKLINLKSVMNFFNQAESSFMIPDSENF